MTGLWPALWGHTLADVFGLGQDAEELAGWAGDNLHPAGPYAALRVGGQPYGLLPTTELAAWKPAPGDPPVEAPLPSALAAAGAHWARAAEQGGGRSRAPTQSGCSTWWATPPGHLATPPGCWTRWSCGWPRCTRPARRSAGQTCSTRGARRSRWPGRSGSTRCAATARAAPATGCGCRWSCRRSCRRGFPSVRYCATSSTRPRRPQQPGQPAHAHPGDLARRQRPAGAGGQVAAGGDRGGRP